MWTDLIPSVLRSRSAFAFFGSKSVKKRKEWFSDFCNGLSRIPDEKVREVYFQEFTLQPYAGFFLFFLLLEDRSSELELIKMAFTNATDFDYLCYAWIEDISP